MNTIQSFLEDSFIYLKPLSLEHLTQTYVDWFNNPSICKYNSHHRFANSFAKTQDYIEMAIRSKENLILAIHHKTSHQHIGNISLQNINFIDSNAELAILIGESSHHSKGIGYQAAKLIIQHGFTALNLHRIYCGTSIENIPMQKLASKLNFQQEGISKQALFKNSHFIDIIHYGYINPYHLS